MDPMGTYIYIYTWTFPKLSTTAEIAAEQIPAWSLPSSSSPGHCPSTCGQGPGGTPQEMAIEPSRMVV